MADSTPELIFVRDLDERFESRRGHARAVDAGTEIRLARGAYIDSATLAMHSGRERYLLVIQAVIGTRINRPVLSHLSAAAIHGLPIRGSWPREVHVTVPASDGSRSRNGVVKHHSALADDDVVEISGFLVTSRARTIIDLAIAHSFTDALLAADRFLFVDRFGQIAPMGVKGDLQQTLDRMKPFRAHRKAQLVVDRSEDRAESPLESLSRASMIIARLPRPALQVPHYDSRGFIGEPDFSWPEFGVLGEADGDAKYSDARFRAGRTPQQVFADERRRHNRLVALPRTVRRWDWEIASDPLRLRALLVEAGLPADVEWR